MQHLKTYRGQRFEEGVEVYVHQGGRSYPLADARHIRNHSPSGFEWGYGGSGPAQLALAILADYLGPAKQPNACPFCEVQMKSGLCPECGYDPTEDQWGHIQGGILHYQDFKRDVVAKLATQQWELTGEQISQWIKANSRVAA